MSLSNPKPKDIDPQDINVIDAKFTDLGTPGFVAAFTLDEAEEAGAFQEDALSESEALESAIEEGR